MRRLRLVEKIGGRDARGQTLIVEAQNLTRLNEAAERRKAQAAR